jgi:hypothetical protein
LSVASASASGCCWPSWSVTWRGCLARTTKRLPCSSRCASRRELSAFAIEQVNHLRTMLQASFDVVDQGRPPIRFLLFGCEVLGLLVSARCIASRVRAHADNSQGCTYGLCLHGEGDMGEEPTSPLGESPKPVAWGGVGELRGVVGTQNEPHLLGALHGGSVVRSENPLHGHLVGAQKAIRRFQLRIVLGRIRKARGGIGSQSLHSPQKALAQAYISKFRPCKVVQCCHRLASITLVLAWQENCVGSLGAHLDTPWGSWRAVGALA